jgi:DNA invertase Pin-like site-specific DNA recombinase
LTYGRLSTEEQEREGLSLPAQLADCRRYAAAHGWAIGGEYRDVLSGRRADRPDYQRLLADVRRLCAEGRRVVVVCKWLHRLGRRVLEAVRCREELRGLGVPVHSVMEGGEVSDFVANVMASVAEEEVRQMGERIAEVIRHTRANGWHHVGRPRWGYRWRDATPEERAQGAPKRVLEFHPDEAPFAAEAWRRAAAGDSLRSVADWAAGLPDEARGGRTLRRVEITKLMHAAVYVARDDRGAPGTPGVTDVLARPRGRWPALVDDDTWRRVQERIAGHRRLPHQGSARYVLTGLIRCPRCGARMTGWGPRVGPGQNPSARRRYRCYGYMYGARAPDRKCTATVSRNAVDRAVLDEVGAVLAAVADLDRGDPELRAALRRAWRDLQRPRFGEAAQHGRRARQLEQRAAQATARLRRATDKYVDDKLTDDEYQAKRAREEAIRDRALADLAALRDEPVPEPLPPLEAVLAEVGTWDEALRGMDPADQRRALSVLIDRVEPRRVRWGVYEVRIDWTPTGKALRQLSATVAPARPAGEGKGSSECPD